MTAGKIELSSVWTRLTDAEKYSAVRNLQGPELFSVLVSSAEVLTNKQYNNSAYTDQKEQMLGDFVTHLRRVITALSINITPQLSAILRSTQWSNSFIRDSRLYTICNAGASSLSINGRTFSISLSLGLVANINYVDYVVNKVGSILEDRATYSHKDGITNNATEATAITYGRPAEGKHHSMPIFSSDPTTNIGFTQMELALSEINQIGKKREV